MKLKAYAMTTFTLAVKNMVCPRCTLAVEGTLIKTAVLYEKVSLGKIILATEISGGQMERLTDELRLLGFELLNHHKAILIEGIKQIVIKRARSQADEPIRESKLSYQISSSLHYEYTYLSSLFSSVVGKSIEKYFLEQRIEKVKELLVYDELSLSEIAYMFGYSSTAYLSNQFKRVTGFNPTQFKLSRKDTRKSVADV